MHLKGYSDQDFVVHFLANHSEGHLILCFKNLNYSSVIIPFASIQALMNHYELSIWSNNECTFSNHVMPSQYPSPGPTSL